MCPSGQVFLGLRDLGVGLCILLVGIGVVILKGRGLLLLGMVSWLHLLSLHWHQGSLTRAINRRHSRPNNPRTSKSSNETRRIPTNTQLANPPTRRTHPFLHQKTLFLFTSTNAPQTRFADGFPRRLLQSHRRYFLRRCG
jgi:hypothetical protein